MGIGTHQEYAVEEGQHIPDVLFIAITNQPA